jgi:cell division protein FtsB
MDILQARTEANQQEMIAKMDARVEGMEDCIRKLESSREKLDAIAEHH